MSTPKKPRGTHAHTPIRYSPEYYPLAALAMEELLAEKRILTPREIRAELELAKGRGPQVGAKLVAKCWLEPAFRAAMLENGKEALAAIGIKFGEAQLIVLENTEKVHHLICCTLCSCYPRSLLGQPPFWYRNAEYRARAVREPRKVLREMGVRIAPEVAVYVHDSNADVRYMVIPRRPAGTEGWDEAALAALVTRESLIGAGLAKQLPKPRKKPAA